MNATQQVACNCNTCPGTGCTCGCQQAAAPNTCGSQCACDAQCQCSAGASCAQA